MGKRGTNRQDIREKMEVVRRVMDTWQPDENCAFVMGLKWIARNAQEEVCGDRSNPLNFKSTAWVKAALKRLVESGEVLEVVCLQTRKHYWMLNKPLDNPVK
jgi:hypothetical protein